MLTLLAHGPTDARGEFTRLRHGNLFHLESGSGRPLVLLQGAGGGAANWYRLIGPLSQERRVLAPELPGFGISDRIAVREPLGGSAAEVLREWLAARIGEEAFDLVATSFGGLVALRLAERTPLMERLVLLNATGLGRGVCLPARLASLPGMRRITSAPSRAGATLLLRLLLTSDRSRLDAAQERALVEYQWRTARAGAGSVLAESLRYFAGLRGQREVVTPAELARIRIPVLILWGTRDRFLPLRHGRRAAAALADGRFTTLEGAGHSPNWEDPEGVLAHVRPFLGIA